jgi:DNA-binding FadR family transcriptional regulator
VPGASLAARRRTSEQLGRLTDIVAQQDECGDPEEWVRLDAAFHFVLAEATWNQVQVRLVGNLRELLVEQSLAVASVPGRLAAATGEHRAILEAVRAGDEAGARAAMARHLDGIQTESHRLGTDTTQGRGSHR